MPPPVPSAFAENVTRWLARQHGLHGEASVQAAAYLTFPVIQIHAALARELGGHVIVEPGAAVYASAVLEYLTAEMLELAENAARDNRRDSMTARHVTLGIRNDSELDELFRHATILEGGVVPNIHAALQPAGLPSPTSTLSLPLSAS